MEQFGIDNTTKLLLWIAGTSNEVEAAAQDGKFSLMEIIGLWDNTAEATSLATKFKDIGQELSDLSIQEKDIIIQRFAGEFELSDQKAERIVEHCIDIALTMSSKITTLVELIKN